MNLFTLRTQVKPLLERYATIPIARVLMRSHVSPNMLTILGLVLSVVAGYLISRGDLLVGAIVMLVGATFDMLDGTLARLSDRISKIGGFLDSFADRLGEIALFLGFFIYYMDANKEAGIYLAIGALLTSQMVSYIRARAEGLGMHAAVGLMGRPERIIVLGLGIIAGYPLYSIGIILVLSLVTMAQRLRHVLQQQ